jgi:hypothetical protein
MSAITDIRPSVIYARIVWCGNYVRFDRSVVYGPSHTIVARVASVPFGPFGGDGSIEAYRTIVGEGRDRNYVRFGCCVPSIPSPPTTSGSSSSVRSWVDTTSALSWAKKLSSYVAYIRAQRMLNLRAGSKVQTKLRVNQVGRDEIEQGNSPGMNKPKPRTVGSH